MRQPQPTGAFVPITSNLYQENTTFDAFERSIVRVYRTARQGPGRPSGREGGSTSTPPWPTPRSTWSSSPPPTLFTPPRPAALDAGKAVVIDKPFAVTVDEARAVADHAGRAGKLLNIFHNRRWDSDFLTLKALIADGTLGEIVQYESISTATARWSATAGAKSLGPACCWTWART